MMRRILVIDDEPFRYNRFYPLAMTLGCEVTIHHDPTLLRLYFDHPRPESKVIGVCLDHDMPLADGTQLARTFLIERNIPVAVVSGNAAGRQRILELLREFEVPCVETPATTSGWEEIALDFFAAAMRQLCR